MKKLLLFLLMITSLNYYSQSFNLRGNIKNILGENIENVNITNSTSNESYVSNNKGNYKIPVKEGDVITFSHVSYASVIYCVKKSKSANIVLADSNNQLSEVTIKTKKRRKKTRYNIGLARIDVRSNNYFYGDRIMPNYFSIGQMLQGKVAGLTVKPSEIPFSYNVYLRGNPVLWDFNGMLMDREPPIISNEIMSIAILRFPGETITYGARGSGGVIVVRTFPDEFMRELIDNESVDNPITNDNFYLGDAIPYQSVDKKFKYVNSYQNLNNETDISKKYIEAKKKYRTNDDFFKQNIFFLKENNFSNDIISEVIKDYHNKSRDNIEKLKFIAFNYSALNEYEKAIKTYKKIALEKLDSPESFRNLASTYIQNKDYVNAWKVYKYFLIKGNKIDDSNLGKIINAEMLMTYQKLKEQNMISEKFKFNEFSSIEKSDVRIVFEWSKDSNVAFELVNPKKQSYTYSTVNKEIKSTFKDFYITDLDDGEWKVNIVAANNKNEPTLLKSTLYRNWGKPNQTQTSKIFYLDKKNLKYNLYDF